MKAVDFRPDLSCYIDSAMLEERGDTHLQWVMGTAISLGMEMRYLLVWRKKRKEVMMVLGT